MTYTVRPMIEDDIPAAIELVHTNWLDCQYNDLTFDRPGAVALLDMSLRCDEVQVFVVETDLHEVVGLIGAIITKMPWFEEKFASEQVFSLHPDHRGYKQAILLLRAYKNWAVLSGAKVLNCLVDHGTEHERKAKLYERAGFVRSGIALAMRS